MSQTTGLFPTTVLVQCRNEPVFRAVIFWAPLLGPRITCPHCARDYYRHEGEEGEVQWISDRPLVFTETIPQRISPDGNLY